jgi:aspartate aminotransferase
MATTPIQTATYFTDPRLADRVPNQRAKDMEGSAILAIAAHVGQLQAKGQRVTNFTIGDFDPKIFPIPRPLLEGVVAKLEAGETRYPPAVGMPQLISAIRAHTKRHQGLDYPEGTVQVGAGARPPIYATFESLLEPGDVVLYPVPSWNVGYYVFLRGGVGVPIVTSPETSFMPTAQQILPHLERAQLLLLNSPLNPTGTVIAPELLHEICEAIVAENRRRLDDGRRPLMLIYDQVYWQLTFGKYRHVTPIELVPEMAAYTILVDAISKSWSATGLRVGWSIAPPYVSSRLLTLIGHVGAWAARAEQLATADLLNDDAAQATFMEPYKEAVQKRLSGLYDGLMALRAAGLPVDAIDPQGAIYLSARFPLHGRVVRGRHVETDEDLRILLVEEAGVAVVPFTAFGYPEGSGWVRFSVGACTEADVVEAVRRLGELFQG